MPFQPCPGVAKIAVKYIQDGQQLMNIYHAGKDSVWTETELRDLAQVMVAWAETHLLPTQSNTVTLEEVEVTDLSVEGGLQWLELPVGSGIGGTEAAPLPNNVSLVAKFTTGHSGRSFRGRTYYIGLTEGVVTSNTVSTTFLGALLAIYELLITTVRDNTAGALCVLSRYHNLVQRTEGTFTEINATALEKVVDSQRRRLPGRGA